MINPLILSNIVTGFLYMPDFVKVCLIYEFLPQAYGFSFQLGDTGIQNFL